MSDIQHLAVLFAAVWLAKQAGRHINLADFPEFAAALHAFALQNGQTAAQALAYVEAWYRNHHRV